MSKPDTSLVMNGYYPFSIIHNQVSKWNTTDWQDFDRAAFTYKNMTVPEECKSLLINALQWVSYVERYRAETNS